MLIFIVYSLGLEGSAPYFVFFLIGLLGIICGKYLKYWLCGIITAITLAGSIYLLATMKEMAYVYAIVDLGFSLILSASMWITVLVTNYNNPNFQNSIQKLKSSILR